MENNNNNTQNLNYFSVLFLNIPIGYVQDIKDKFDLINAEIIKIEYCNTDSYLPYLCKPPEDAMTVNIKVTCYSDMDNLNSFKDWILQSKDLFNENCEQLSKCLEVTV